MDGEFQCDQRAVSSGTGGQVGGGMGLSWHWAHIYHCRSGESSGFEMERMGWLVGWWVDR